MGMEVDDEGAGDGDCGFDSVWGGGTFRPVEWGMREGSGRSAGRERGVHPLFPAILSGEQEG
jgi:hypothetical protein